MRNTAIISEGAAMNNREDKKERKKHEVNHDVDDLPEV
jgi:hypothetical protein